MVAGEDLAGAEVAAGAEVGNLFVRPTACICGLLSGWVYRHNPCLLATGLVREFVGCESLRDRSTGAIQGGSPLGRIEQRAGMMRAGMIKSGNDVDSPAGA